MLVTVINNKYKQILFLVLILNINICVSQRINDYDKFQYEKIEIPKTNDEKINIFIFINSETDSNETYYLLNGLDSINSLIDYDNFNIFRFKIKPVMLCPTKIEFILDGYSFLPPRFEFSPYRILVRADLSVFNLLLKTRFDKNKEFHFVSNIDDQKSPFVRIEKTIDLYKLVQRPLIIDTIGFETQKKINVKLNYEDSLNELKKIKLNNSTNTYVFLNGGYAVTQFEEYTPLAGFGEIGIKYSFKNNTLVPLEFLKNISVLVSIDAQMFYKKSDLNNINIRKYDSKIYGVNIGAEYNYKMQKNWTLDGGFGIGYSMFGSQFEGKLPNGSEFNKSNRLIYYKPFIQIHKEYLETGLGLQFGLNNTFIDSYYVDLVKSNKSAHLDSYFGIYFGVTKSIW